MYTTCANTSNNTPSYTHVSSYVVWRIHRLGFSEKTTIMTHANSLLEI